MHNMNTHVVIMAGGIGSRFWPLSTPQNPKQFIDILGCGKSLIRLTADRFKGLCPPERLWVGTNAAYIEAVKRHVPGILESHILAEPAARNTAPCIAWACREILKEDPDANIVVTPSDAFVADPDEFRRVIAAALECTASRDCVVTIGIKPTRPETGYGYILTTCGEGVLPVEAFKEKPSAATAQRYLEEGGYLWNAGIFVWKAAFAQRLIGEHCPQIARIMDLIARGGDVAQLFPQCEKISIDYAVMEKAAARGLVRTIPADFGWSDLGNWASLREHVESDPEGNAAVGDVSLFECRDCVVHAQDASKVVLQGLEGYIVALKDGKLLVCRRSEEQRIKDFQNVSTNK